MILLLFAIDGTLIETSRDGGRMLAGALQEVAGVDAVPDDWEVFDEVTSPAIARDLIAQKHRRRARDGEVFLVRQAVAARWKKALEAAEVAVRPVAGAAALLAQARARAGHFVAVTTGDWGPPALLRLQAAKLPVDGLVLVSADDSESRQGILNTAAIVAAAERGIPGFAGVVLVGHAIWHARAALANKAGFVGLAASADEAVRLRAEGAAAVVPDFLDSGRFWKAVDAAVRGLRATGGN